jgi:hypothetical protein
MVGLLLSDDELPEKYSLYLVRVLRATIIKACGEKLLLGEQDRLTRGQKKEGTKQQKVSVPM